MWVYESLHVGTFKSSRKLRPIRVPSFKTRGHKSTDTETHTSLIVLQRVEMIYIYILTIYTSTPATLDSVFAFVSFNFTDSFIRGYLDFWFILSFIIQHQYAL